MAHDHDVDEVEEHDRGLSPGLAAALAGCGISGGDDSAAGSAGTGTAGSGAAPSSGSGSGTSSGSGIPEETAGPYPGDGSNGVNVLSESGIVRSDITRSFGSGSGVAEGMPLTVTLKVLDTAGDAAPRQAAAVYLWHCDREGRYSLYDDEIRNENYLRGVQQTAADGTVTFKSIFPAAYSGRWPHIHFEVYPSLDAATSASGKLRTSQLAFPEDACKQVYATDGYARSLQNLSQVSLDTDMVFGDGYSLQLAKVTGDVSDGMTATLNVPV